MFQGKVSASRPWRLRDESDLTKFIQIPYWLVVSTPLEKYEFVSWDDFSQYMESHKSI